MQPLNSNRIFKAVNITMTGSCANYHMISLLEHIY